jgi:hypothetical protein
MDTLKILLGATVALLLAALGLSWKNLQTGSNDPKELSEQQMELKKLQVEHERLQLEVMRLTNQQGGAPAPAPTASTTQVQAAPSQAEIEAAKAEIEQIELERKKAAAAASQEAAFIEGKQQPKTTLPDKAAEKVSRRLAMIQQSMLMGHVVEWVDSPDAGSFATIEITSPENVQAGTELLIRRNGGILGKLRVDRIEPDGTIANPITKFSGAKPVQGDELILEPPFVGAIEDTLPADPNAPGH